MRLRQDRNDLAAKSRLISRRILSLDRFRNSLKIALYYPVRNEVDTLDVFSHCLESGKDVYFPRVSGLTLSFHRVHDLAELTPGAYGIPEPSPESDAIEPGNLDLILVPGVAFDRSGRRLGYGKGYYDRAMINTALHKRVSLAYGFQVLDSVPAGKNDLGTGTVVTESAVFALSD